MFKTLLRFTAFKSGGGCARDLLLSFGSSQKKELGSLLKEQSQNIDLSTSLEMTGRERLRWQEVSLIPYTHEDSRSDLL